MESVYERHSNLIIGALQRKFFVHFFKELVGSGSKTPSPFAAVDERHRTIEKGAVALFYNGPMIGDLGNSTSYETGGPTMQTIDQFSYQCGVIDCFNEMVSAGVKALALSHPYDTAQFRDELIPFAHELCKKYGTKLYLEDTLLLTDLFPVASQRGKSCILFYKEDHTIEEYIRLKDRKTAMVASGAYFGGNRTQIAWSLGRLLSYCDEAIRRLISENTDKEQV